MCALYMYVYVLTCIEGVPCAGHCARGFIKGDYKSSKIYQIINLLLFLLSLLPSYSAGINFYVTKGKPLAQL